MKKKSLAISWQVVTAIVIGLGVFWTIGKCLNKAYDKVEKGDREEAIADYSQAIKLNPDDANAYYNRGIDRYDLKDYQGAIADYTEAIKLNPDFADAYYNRGVARDDLKDYEGAHSPRIRGECADYTIAIKLNPDFTHAYENRGRARFKLKDYSGAITDYLISFYRGIRKIIFHRVPE